MKIGLLDQMGAGNLGDAATQDAVIHHIRRRLPDASIHGFSFSPEDTERRHGLPSFAIRRRQTSEPSPRRLPPIAAAAAILRRVPKVGGVPAALHDLRRETEFWRHSYQVLRDFDVLIISGGGQLDDMWGGAWGAPFTIFAWSILARLTNTRLLFLSVGAGPLRSRLSQAFVRVSLQLAEYRSFRDDPSRELVEALGVRLEDPVCPDMAFALPVPAISDDKPGAGGKVVGIAPIPYCDPRGWPTPSSESYRNYVAKLTRFTVWLLANGHAVRFLTSNVNMDLRVVRDIQAGLAREPMLDLEGRVFQEPISTVTDLLDEISRADVVVSSRLHGVLLAHLLRRPVIAVSYHQKIDTLMSVMGQPDDVVPIATFEPDELIERFEAINADRLTITTTLAERVHARRQLLDRMFDQVFGAVAE